MPRKNLKTIRDHFKNDNEGFTKFMQREILGIDENGDELEGWNNGSPDQDIFNPLPPKKQTPKQPKAPPKPKKEIDRTFINMRHGECDLAFVKCLLCNKKLLDDLNKACGICFKCDGRMTKEETHVLASEINKMKLKVLEDMLKNPPKRPTSLIRVQNQITVNLDEISKRPIKQEDSDDESSEDEDPRNIKVNMKDGSHGIISFD